MSNPQSVSRAFVDILREQLHDQGITQTALAEKIGLSQSAISRILRNEVALTLSAALGICDALDLTLPDVYALAEARVS